ncbi:Bug family tripartite tricarboxylate transporter substrate binding protein [Bosea psychrotolerans]|uniref:Tripartite-type tricarboxylate transporter receptor subunit TctC n=1 Tax=Bosea psychrotolerans TaxID=1871628 RepID=A0A2S4M0S3_9HYPH|nr:tripartite tricarboxylate transporter substrate binding protein [Bosea psychrotolerans]POR48326.1 tripartite-type tricarboxylate transporter receptor subunit TctC [Bosea psychrotolerans]
MKPTRILAAAVLAALLAGPSLAQDYPTKPIRLVVPFPPGGGTDVVSRVIAQKLGETTGWTIVVDNKPGSGGSVGLSLAGKAPADGYTLVMAQNANLVINPILGKANYDPVKDFAPIGLAASAPQVLVVAKDSPIKTVEDLLAAAKAKGGKLTFASPGIGTSSHLAGELLQQIAQVKFRHVPYKGASQALPDLMGGRIDVYVSSVPSVSVQIKEGVLRPVALFATKRDAEFPDVPTFEEKGIKNSDAATWWGLAAPAGTPAEVIARLNTELNRVLKLPDTQARLRSAGAEATGSSAEAFAALVKSDVPKWTAVIKAADIKVAD